MKKWGGSLSLRELLAYGAGGLVVNLMAVGDQFGMYYLTNIAAVPAATVGMIMLFCTAFDAVNDPMIGNMADQCNTSIGKYRPFMIGGGLLMCLTMILRFTTPPFGDVGKILYYTVVLAVLSMGFTALTVPWQAFMSILSKDYHDRNILMTVRGISGTLVNTLIGSTVLVSVERLGGGAPGWQRYMLVLWAFGLCMLFFCQHGMKRVDYPGSIPTPPRRPFFRNMLRMAKNKPVMCVAAAVCVTALIQTMMSVSSMYYYQYVVGDTGVLAKVSVLSLPLSIIGPILIPIILTGVSKRNMFLGGFVISLIRPLGLICFGASLSPAVATWLVVISRVGIMFFNSAFYLWIPECVDWTNLKEGAGNAALISATITFLQKMGRAVGQWLTGLLMGLAGFVAGAETTPQIVGQILRINGVYQLAGFLIALIPVFLFPISRRQGEEIRAALARRDPPGE